MSDLIALCLLVSALIVKLLCEKFSPRPICVSSGHISCNQNVAIKKSLSSYLLMSKLNLQINLVTYPLSEWRENYIRHFSSEYFIPASSLQISYIFINIQLIIFVYILYKYTLNKLRYILNSLLAYLYLQIYYHIET